MRKKEGRKMKEEEKKEGRKAGREGRKGRKEGRCWVLVAAPLWAPLCMLMILERLLSLSPSLE